MNYENNHVGPRKLYYHKLLSILAMEVAILSGIKLLIICLRGEESGDEATRTWLKLSSALCRLASMPVGGSLVILMEDSRMPWGMMWDSGMGAGSADM